MFFSLKLVWYQFGELLVSVWRIICTALHCVALVQWQGLMQSGRQKRC